MIASSQRYLLAMQEFCFDFIQKTLEQISLSYSLTKIANLNNYTQDITKCIIIQISNFCNV